jgi:hypothetical protein
MNTDQQAESLTTYWSQQIQSWQKTNQSQSDYCRNHDLNYHRFTYWRRKLSGQARPPQTAVQRSAFVPVKPSPSVDTEGLTAILPNGVVLQGITERHLAVARQLLGLLP